MTGKGLGFWLKQLQSEEEVFQSNLSTVANIDTDESLDGNDSNADVGIEFSAKDTGSDKGLYI